MHNEAIDHPRVIHKHFQDTRIDTLETFREQMFAFAKLQLDDKTLAEDAVQEAMLGAVKNQDKFSGKAAYKTWVFAILKYKIVDIIRKRQKQNENITLYSDLDNTEGEIWQTFEENGTWQHDQPPNNWGKPEETFANDEFWKVFELCLNRLPANQAKLFMLREYFGLETKEICEQNNLTVNNLNVTLYRARTKLQKCLQATWFRDTGHA